MRVAFYTLGCKVNQYETQCMIEELLQHGFEIVGQDSVPEVYVINSCTVTAESDRKSKQQVRKFRKLFPEAIIVLTGCMPQAFPDLQKDFLFADIILGNGCGRDIYSSIHKFISTGQRVINISAHTRDEGISDLKVTNFKNHTRAFLKIEDGCNRYCSYCIIPKARGFVRSKTLHDIQSEVEKLAANNFTEIVLVGINLSAYGSDIDTDLLQAINAVSENPKIKRIRLGSLEPFILNEHMLKSLAINDKFCPHFHISLQSGSDGVLHRMNRNYTTNEYSEICENISRIFTNHSITTDIMVGFPGETTEEFLESMNFARKINFSSAHVFAYSQREGTAAVELPDQINSGVKAKRCREMIALCDELKTNNYKTLIGSNHTVLIEREYKNYFIGFTKTYIEVKISNKVHLKIGEIVPVTITGYDNQSLIAEL